MKTREERIRLEMVKAEEKLIMRRTETGRKNGKFYYEIIVERTGEVLYDRSSNREYVASVCGMFFGRADLVGKGDHGKYGKYIAEGRWTILEDRMAIGITIDIIEKQWWNVAYLVEQMH